VRVLADPARLVQVLTNILDNAAKYSPEGSAIEVRWHVDAKRATVHVRDHGPGIPAEARQRLFTRFGRLPGSVMRAGRSGTGLGLFLARQLTGAMGGSLDLADSGPHGSTFRLQLPLAPD
jgi:signal transduction histidine kinase